MSDQALRALLSTAVEQLRDATDLTTDEVIGMSALPPTMLTPDVCYSLGLLKGAAAALRLTQREMLEELDLLTAPRRSA